MVNEAEAVPRGCFRYFFNKTFPCQFPPNWFLDPFDDASICADIPQRSHWSDIPDFLPHGDIKCIWELSRFSWVFPLVRAYLAKPTDVCAEVFWQLVEDWAERNPPNTGVQWKCGQEIAFRIFALVTGYYTFQDARALTGARKRLIGKILAESAARIQANITYALSQKNNHGISEAAGLFTAGVLLKHPGWRENGKQLLESQARELIYPDGSFSQHSANYHRVMLHDYLWSIQLGRANGVEFSGEMIGKIRKAGEWLIALYDPQSGRMPNLGSNDGACVLPFSACNYFDFRPTIQAVAAVVDGRRWLPTGDWDDLALWLVPKLEPEFDLKNVAIDRGYPRLKVLKDGGYAVFSGDRSKLMFRCPQRFRHRPAQCDLLHVDLWVSGVNVLRDAGTYSYNCPQPWLDYFKSVAGHNTIQFDDHDQMPTISRFLYGKWPRLIVEEGSGGANLVVSAGYIDWKGCRHHRKIEALGNKWRVTDEMGGFQNKAVMRWRLAPEIKWDLTSSTCASEIVEISVVADDGLRAITMSSGWESLYYMEKSEIPVLSTAVSPACTKLVTTIRLAS